MNLPGRGNVQGESHADRWLAISGLLCQNVPTFWIFLLKTKNIVRGLSIELFHFRILKDDYAIGVSLAVEAFEIIPKYFRPIIEDIGKFISFIVNNNITRYIIY